MDKRIVFHVGLAKTGTTSFQHECHRARRLLARHGVLYPRAMEGFAKNHSPLAASYLAHRPYDPTIAPRVVPRAQAVARLRAEIDASPCPLALVSSEHLSIHFDTYEADHLAEDFAAYDPLIVVAIREPYGRFLSMWNTHVTAGGRLSLEEFGGTVLVPDNRYISIRETLAIWRETFGAQRVRIVDWDSRRDVSAALLDACGITDGGITDGGIAARLPRGRRRRASLPLAAIETLRLVNAAIVARQGAAPADLASWAQLSGFSTLAQQRLARRTLANARPTVSPQTMAQLDLIYENDRTFLAEAYGHALASTRERYVIGEPVAPDAAKLREAEALLCRVSRGLWGPSRVAMAGMRALSRRRGAARASDSG